MIRIIDVFYISLVCIHLDLNQLIMMRLSRLMKTSSKKNIMTDMMTNMTIIMKKISIRKIIKKKNKLIMFTEMLLSQLKTLSCLKNWLIILIFFMFKLISLTLMYAACVKQCSHQTISYISTYSQLTEESNLSNLFLWSQTWNLSLKQSQLTLMSISMLLTLLNWIWSTSLMNLTAISQLTLHDSNVSIQV